MKSDQQEYLKIKEGLLKAASLTPIRIWFACDKSSPAQKSERDVQMQLTDLVRVRTFAPPSEASPKQKCWYHCIERPGYALLDLKAPTRLEVLPICSCFMGMRVPFVIDADAGCGQGKYSTMCISTTSQFPSPLTRINRSNRSCMGGHPSHSSHH